MAMSLPELITELGDEAAADLFGVKLRTVQSWRRRERYPRAGQARLIVARSGGRTDFAGIFDSPPSEPAPECAQANAA